MSFLQAELSTWDNKIQQAIMRRLPSYNQAESLQCPTRCARALGKDLISRASERLRHCSFLLR